MNIIQESLLSRDKPEMVNSLGIGKRWFYSFAQYPVPLEHIWDIEPDKVFLRSLSTKGIDLFSFIQRTFLGDKLRKYLFYSNFEPIGLLRLSSFDEWLKLTKYNARRYIRKGAKLGVTAELANIDERFIRSALRIYNETPIRQGRKYSGYGLTIGDLKNKFVNMENSEVLGAYFKNELIGLLWISYGHKVAAFRSFLSLIKYRDKYPNNVLLAESVKRCCEKGFQFLTYGNMGYLPNLDFFKSSHGFRIFLVPRYYVPLSTKGQLAIRLKVCRPLEHSFPRKLIPALLPLYNFVSKGIANRLSTNAD
jgi:hypothetical protein